MVRQTTQRVTKILRSLGRYLGPSEAGEDRYHRQRIIQDLPVKVTLLHLPMFSDL